MPKATIIIWTYIFLTVVWMIRLMLIFLEDENNVDSLREAFSLAPEKMPMLIALIVFFVLFFIVSSFWPFIEGFAIIKSMHKKKGK